MADFSGIKSIKETRPLVHCINNIVSANDCANLLLAIGASPMMAEAPAEMIEITKTASATVLNTGTPSTLKYEACSICGMESAALGKPVVLDPVGVGASFWRLWNVCSLLEGFRPDIIRVNLGEAKALLKKLTEKSLSMPQEDVFSAKADPHAGEWGADSAATEQGVDSVIKASPKDREETAVRLAKELQTVVLMTGPEDIVTDGARIKRIGGGSDRMTLVTGSGCMLSCLCGAFLAVCPDAFEAACEASSFWKLCAAMAEENSSGCRLSSALLLDAAYQLSVRE